MPHSDFVHLHLHSQYSLLDGACLLKKLLQLASHHKMPALALTDHGNMFGAIEFYLEAQRSGVKPIIGCETYIAPKSRFDKSSTGIKESNHHFILLCKDEEGYHNLMKLARELSLPLVATNDVHYLTRQAAKAHEALLCIQTQATLSDPGHMRFHSEEFYFKNADEMKALFKELPEAITNTIAITEKCNLELNFKQLHLPLYEAPVGKTKDEFLRGLCEKGLTKRFPEETNDIRERLEYELETIKKIGFTSYFLIVWDFIHYAKSKGIPVGPGRGSAAGSLVSYLLEITDINPLKYGLLFERFLNPERIGMPDIDIDFCYERRQEVIDYVTKKYGQKNVAQIITFGTMLARAVIRDVGRVMGMSYADVDKIAKLIPVELNITLDDALHQEPELEHLYKSDASVTQLIDTAKSLEGLTRHASTHAAGVVISDKPLDYYVPLF